MAGVTLEVAGNNRIDGVEQLTRYLDLLNRDPCCPRLDDPTEWLP